MNSKGSFTRERIPVQSLKFSTHTLKPNEQLDAWRAFARGMSDVETAAAPNEGFLASAEIHQLGGLTLTNYALPPLTLTYGDDAIRRSSLDHWCFGVVTEGRVTVDSDQKGFSAATGDLALYSYAAPFAGKLDKASYTSLFFSRDEFWDVADELDSVSHLRIGGPMSHIVADFIMSVKNRANALTTTDAAAVSEAFGTLVRAMVHQTATNAEAARAPIAATRFDRVRRFIAENLRSPDLSPETICARLGLSRRYLYYLFERHGGVATFIKNRRLAACYKALSRTRETKLISSIAYEYGFADASVFSRQFKERYGMRPSEVYAAHLAGHDTGNVTSLSFVDWLSRATAT